MPAPKMSLGDELARLSLQEPLPIIPGDQKQLRKRLIRERINLLERARAHLQPHEKWPTTGAVQAYREELAQSKSTGGLDCSSDVDPSPLKRQPNHDPSHFPFPVLGVKERATRFMPFQRLPIEIRHIIWRIAAEHPRFIEIQDFKKAKPDVIVKAIGDHVLEAVCTESREIALQGRTRRAFVGESKVVSADEYTGCVRRVTYNLSDTVLLREAEVRKHSWFSTNLYLDFCGLKHMALPLSVFDSRYSKGPYPIALANMIFELRLETLTLVLGAYHNTWLSVKYVELRDLEEFFLDGRDRSFEWGSWKGDISELAGYLEGLTRGIRAIPIFAKHVRVVAWNKKD